MSLFSALRDGYYSRNGKSRKSRRGPGHSWSSAARLARTRPGTLVEALESRQLLSALVTTDQGDYAPGSTAIITAANDAGPLTNFAVGETVHFHIDRTDGVPVNAPPAVQDWYVKDGE